MTYDTVLTSKGTITLAAPIRRRLSMKSGQKIRMSLNNSGQVVLDTGTTWSDFEAQTKLVRANIPARLRMLTVDELRGLTDKKRSQEYLRELDDKS